MIRFFRTKRKTTGVILFIFAAALMVTFGMDFQGGTNTQNRQAAITIDDIEITHAEYFDRRRDVESRYRQMFGAQYDTFAKQLGLNVPQQVLDTMIAERVVAREASAKRFIASDEEIVGELQRIFPSGYSPDLLRSTGRTPESFLEELNAGVARGHLLGAFEDAAVVSRKEAMHALQVKARSYDLQYAEFDPENFLTAVPAPSEEALKSFYEERKEDFQIPSRVAYEYVPFNPESFLNQIEIPQEEVEFHYTENQDAFMNPEALRIRHIQLLYPKDGDATAMAAVRERAQKIHERAMRGEDFAKLALEASDDITTKTLGGDLGWVERGKRPAAFDEKTYAVKAGGIADLIETESGFHIAKVEGYRESTLRPLAEVQSEILAKLRKEQAPAVAHAKAEEFYDKFTQSANTATALGEISASYSLTVARSNGLLSENQDPSPALAGLTSKVIQNVADTKQMIDLKDVTLVVFVTEFKEPEIPSLDSVKDKVVLEYKKVESVNLARNAASSLLETVKGSPHKEFEGVAKSAKAPLKELNGFKELGAPRTGPFSDTQVQKLIRTINSAPSRPTQVYSVDGKFYLVSVKRIIDTPVPSETKEKIDERFALASAEANNLIEAYTEYLKSKAKIDFDRSLLGVNS